MKWKLFLDDERYPTSPDWYVARTSYDAIKAVMDWGMPVEMALDHDLGGEDTTMVFLRKLVDLLDEELLVFPPDFHYSVHSQNPVGAENIRGYMDNMIQWYT